MAGLSKSSRSLRFTGFSLVLSRQLPHPKTQQRRDHGERRADPKWDRLSAESDLGLAQETEKMAESKEGEKERCDS